MTGPRSIRASDGDRERVVAALREQTAQGRLTLEEFEERMDAAYTASTWGDLQPLTRDLPVEVAFGKGEEGAPSPPASQGVGENVCRRDLTRRLLPFAPALLLVSVAVVTAVGGGVARGLPLLLIAAFLVLGGRACRPCPPGNRERHSSEARIHRT